MKKSGKRMIIAVAGCVAQAEGAEIISRAPFVDIVVGPQAYQRLPEMVANAEKTRGGLVELDFAVDEHNKHLVTQDLIVFEMDGEDANGKIIGKHRSTGIARPKFWDRARYYGLEKELAEALDSADT